MTTRFFMPKRKKDDGCLPNGVEDKFHWLDVSTAGGRHVVPYRHVDMRRHKAPAGKQVGIYRRQDIWSKKMAKNIVVRAGGSSFEGELNESVTGRAIYDGLPIRANGQRWGGEIYFGIGVSCELEEGSRDVMEAGELAYWPPGQAFCIFFGATPASGGDEIRAASAVNVVGKIKGDLSGLWDVPDGAEVLIEKDLGL